VTGHFARVGAVLFPLAGDRPLTWGDLSWQVAAFGAEGARVSRVRGLAGTRKGAFVLTSDGKREDCRLRLVRIVISSDRMRT